MSTKTCVPDPIPTALLFECSNQVVLLLTTIVNQFLSPAICSFLYEISRRKTRLKKSLELNVFKNLRLVSNLSFVTKLNEKLVHDQLFCHPDHSANQLITQTKVPKQLSFVSPMTS